MKRREGEEEKHRENFTRRQEKLLNRENTMRKDHLAKERATKRKNGGNMGRYMAEFCTMKGLKLPEYKQPSRQLQYDIERLTCHVSGRLPRPRHSEKELLCIGGVVVG